MIEWKSRFKNKQYDIECIVQNTKDNTDFFPFKLVIDGVGFQSSQLTDWELQDDEIVEFSETRNKFDLYENKYLQDFILKINIDTFVLDTVLNKRLKAVLQVANTFSKTKDSDSVCNSKYAYVENSIFSLIIEEKIFTSNISSEWFEDSLVQICKSLDNKYQLVNCFGCAYSDYSPYGSGNIGNLYCFLNIKDKYLTVISKYATQANDYTVFDAFDEGVHFNVKETDLCENFMPRINTLGGYRGQIYNNN